MEMLLGNRMPELLSELAKRMLGVLSRCWRLQAVLFVSCFFLTAVSGLGASVRKSTSNVITVKQAIGVAGQFVKACAVAKIGALPQWKGAIPANPVTYFNLADTPSAYCFAVVRGPSILGYLMVSAQPGQPSIQEYSCDPPPHSKLDNLQSGALGTILGGAPQGKPKLYRPALGVYLAAFLTGGSEKKPNLVLMDIRSLAKLDSIVLKTKSNLAKGKTAPGVPVPKEQPAFRLITNVPDYPIKAAQAEVVALSKLLGYWGLLRAEEITSGKVVFDYADAESASVPLDTKPWAEWIERQFCARGYSANVGCKVSTAASRDLIARPSDYRTEIDQGRPFLLAISTESKNAASLDASRPQSAFLGVGYLSNSWGRYIVARDPLVREGDYPPRPQTTPSWGQPGIIFYNWAAIAGDIVLTTVRDVTKQESN